MKYEKGSFIVVPNSPALSGIEPTAQAVYLWLCYHANRDGECFPSRRTIAKESGVKSLRTIDRVLAVLIEAGIVVKEGRYDDRKQVSNTYYLPIVAGVEGKKRHGGGANFDTGGRANFDTQNSIHTELNPLNSDCEMPKNGIPPVSKKNDWAKEIPVLLEYFVKINPSISYGNRTQRSAITKMLEKWGPIEVEAMVKKVIAAQGQRYAPVADTPVKMWNKLGEFAIYFKKQGSGIARSIDLNKD